MQPVARPVSLRDVAHAARVHVSTVSRALNNDPKIPVSTRERLQALARELGYQRQPLFAAMSHRRRQPRQQEGVPLVFASHLPYERIGHTGFHLRGAQARGDTLGYNIREEPFPARLTPPFPPLNWRHRGVAGILVGPWLGQEQALLDADLAGFSVIQCGNTWCDAGYHIVRSAVFEGVAECYRQLRSRGYRRIGFCLIRHDPPHPDDFQREAAAHECLLRDGLLEQCPIHFEKGDAHLDLEPWLRRVKPDAIIGFHGGIRTRLLHLGYRVPGDYGFAQLILTPDNPRNHSGIEAADPMVGSTAVELLDTMIRHAETGRPEQRRVTIIDTVWNEGVTAPKVG